MNTKITLTPYKNPEVKYQEMIKFPGIYKLLGSDDGLRIIVNKANYLFVVNIETNEIDSYFPSAWQKHTFVKLIDEEIKIVFTC